MPILNEQDERRYTAPPEPRTERHEEPEDSPDWLDENFPETEQNDPE